MNIITKTFTYNLPNIYGSQDDSEGKTGTLEYEGPEWFFVFVNEKTGILRRDMDTVATDLSNEIEEEAIAKCEEGTVQVLVNANDEPEVAYIMFGLEPKDSEISEERVFLNEGDLEPLFVNSSPLPPKDAYEVENFRWVFGSRSFAKPLPYNITKTEKENWLGQIELAKEEAQEDIDSGELTAEELTLYNEYMDKLNSWEETTSSYPFHLVPMPRHPKDILKFETSDPEDDGDVEPKAEVYIDPQDLDSAYYTEEEMASVLALHKAWSGSADDFAAHVASEKGWTAEATALRIEFLTNEPEAFLTKLETEYLS